MLGRWPTTQNAILPMAPSADTNVIIQFNTFDLTQYDLSLCEIKAHVDPHYPDEGSATVRVVGRVGSTVDRIRLLVGVVPHAQRKRGELLIQHDDMDEPVQATVRAQQQSIPLYEEFVLVWESNTPYFVGTRSGEKYRW